MKTKQKMMAIGLLGALTVPVTFAVACGSSASALPADSIERVALVTDGGSIEDKSFNESAWNALQGVYKEMGKEADQATTVFKPNGTTASELVDQYNAAHSGNYRTIIAPGFFHDAAIRKFNSDVGLNTLQFIGLDFEIKAENVASILFKTYESGFQAGVLSALYLQAIDDQDPKVGTFGGNNFPGVTDFMTGFVYGIKYFNDSVDKNLHKVSYPEVKFYQFTQDADWTNSGFDAGGGKAKADAMVSDNIDIILPVAGPQTADVLAAIKGVSGSTTKAIGVDTDQKLSYPSDKGLILTSILKNIKDAFEAVWKKAWKPDQTHPDWVKGFNETTMGTLANGLTTIEQTEEGNIPTTPVTWESIYTLTNSDAVKDAAQKIDTDWAKALEVAKQMK